MLILMKLDEQTKGIGESNHRISEVQAEVADLNTAKSDFDLWKAQVDSEVSNLRSAVDDLRSQLEHLSMPHIAEDPHLAATSTPKLTPATTHLVGTPAGATSRPDGHRFEPHHRSDGFRVVTTRKPPPVIGANSPPFSWF